MNDQLNEDQMAAFKSAFDMFDQQKECFINIQQISNIMKSLGYNPSQIQLQELISEVDPDQIGTIDYLQFLSVMTQWTKNVQTHEQLQQSFKLFDRSGSGLISADDLRNVMVSLGQKLDKQEANQMIKQADLDKDGFLNYEEFIKMMIAK